MKHLTYIFVGLLVLTLKSQWVYSAGQAQTDVEDPWRRSYALEAKGQYEAAAAVLARQLELSETSEMAWLRYGWLHYLRGNYNDSVTAYKNALRKNKHSLEARLGLTLPLIAQNRWKEASRYAQHVVDGAVWNYTAHMRLLVCEQGLKNWRGVKERSQRLAARYPSEISPWLYLARASSKMGDGDYAINAYRQVLMRDPDNIEANRFVAN